MKKTLKTILKWNKWMMVYILFLLHHDRDDRVYKTYSTNEPAIKIAIGERLICIGELRNNVHFHLNFECNPVCERIWDERERTKINWMLCLGNGMHFCKHSEKKIPIYNMNWNFEFTSILCSNVTVNWYYECNMAIEMHKIAMKLSILRTLNALVIIYGWALMIARIEQQQQR